MMYRDLRFHVLAVMENAPNERALLRVRERPQLDGPRGTRRGAGSAALALDGLDFGLAARIEERRPVETFADAGQAGGALVLVDHRHHAADFEGFVRENDGGPPGSGQGLPDVLFRRL